MSSTAVDSETRAHDSDTEPSTSLPATAQGPFDPLIALLKNHGDAIHGGQFKKYWQKMYGSAFPGDQKGLKDNDFLKRAVQANVCELQMHPQPNGPPILMIRLVGSTEGPVEPVDAPTPVAPVDAPTPDAPVEPVDDAPTSVAHSRQTGTVVYVDPTSGIQGQIRPDTALGCEDHTRIHALTRTHSLRAHARARIHSVHQ